MDRYEYDINNPLDIERYAKRLEGHCIADFLPAQVINAANKGNFGQLVERFLGIPTNSTPGADFSTIGGANVEVKSLPLIETRNGLRAKERLVFNIIDYRSICDENWDNSSFLAKNKLILLVTYLYEHAKNPFEYCVKTVRLLDLTNIPHDDLRIMKEDWEKIVSVIRAGHAESLSESITFYLGACTKGSTAADSLRAQPFSSIPAKQRAFSWKPSYLNHVLTELCCEQNNGHSVFGNYTGSLTFEQLVISMFNKFRDQSAEEIALAIGKQYDTSSKRYLSLVTKAILGASEDEDINEFINADVQVKTICLEKGGRLKESISFPYIRYKDVIDEKWEDSTLRNMLDKKFFFVVFQKTDTGRRLKKALFWNIPIEILENDVRRVWEYTIDLIRQERFDELPGMCWNPVCHVRPHGMNSEDTTETVSGRLVGKKCFWLNNTFILSQIN